MSNNFIDLNIPPRSRVSKKKIEASDPRSHMMTPLILSAAFEQYSEKSNDVFLRLKFEMFAKSYGFDLYPRSLTFGFEKGNTLSSTFEAGRMNNSPFPIFSIGRLKN